MAKERLQKFLARAGVASRRAAEQLIVDGHVRVDGRVTRTLGTQVDSYEQKIEVDGRRVHTEKHVYYVLHKPREMVTTLEDPEGRETIKDLLTHIPERVYPVGRLDYHTSGALLVTNDGELTEALLRPGSHAPKVYAAKMQGHLDEEDLGALRNGIELDDGYTTKQADVFVIREEPRSSWVQLTLGEGKNRQIHRMAEALGRRVLRLIRLSFAGIDTEGLRPKMIRPLTGREIEKLKKNFVTPRRRQKANTKAEDAELLALGKDPVQERKKVAQRRARSAGYSDSDGPARGPAAKKRPPKKRHGADAARPIPRGPKTGSSGARRRTHEARAQELLEESSDGRRGRGKPKKGAAPHKGKSSGEGEGGRSARGPRKSGGEGEGGRSARGPRKSSDGARSARGPRKSSSGDGDDARSARGPRKSSGDGDARSARGPRKSSGDGDARSARGPRKSSGDGAQSSRGPRKAAGGASKAPRKGASKGRGKPARPTKKGPSRGRAKKVSK